MLIYTCFYLKYRPWTSSISITWELIRNSLLGASPHILNPNLQFNKLLRDLWYVKVLEGFLGSSAGKDSASNAGDPSLIPGWGRSP